MSYQVTDTARTLKAAGPDEADPISRSASGPPASCHYPCSSDALLCRAWDTEPEQSHQDGVRGNEQVDAAAKRAYADETAWIEQSQCGIGTDAR